MDPKPGPSHEKPEEEEKPQEVKPQEVKPQEEKPQEETLERPQEETREKSPERPREEQPERPSEEQPGRPREEQPVEERPASSMSGRSSSSRRRREFSFSAFCSMLIPIKSFNFGQLLSSGAGEWQVAGHSGFLTGENADCYKPVNPKCARGRREYLFYQMSRFFTVNPFYAEELPWKEFKIFMHPEKMCDCLIAPDTFATLVPFLATFKHVKHLVLEDDDFETNKEKQADYMRSLFHQDPWCPCYSDDKEAKRACFLDYEQEDYICMEDLHAHCHTPCILDIKMGRITYDPMASEGKKKDQSTKYPRLRDFGFRILGMKTPLTSRDKAFGKTLVSQEMVFEAIEAYFEPLVTSEYKAVVTGRMLDHLEKLLVWFETRNNNQIKFYSSSLLFVYDVSPIALTQFSHEEKLQRLKDRVRVKMIDFAHVFHNHEPPFGSRKSSADEELRLSGELNKDDNYLYGLRRLLKFFIMMNRQHRKRFQQQAEARANDQRRPQ